MRSQDIVILLKLVSLQKDFIEMKEHFDSTAHLNDIFSARALETSLGISKTEVNASINRSINSGLAVLDRINNYPKPNRQALYNFIVSGLKYVFPAKTGALARGIPTAFAAPALKNELLSAGEYIYVWPDATAQERGQSIKPLFSSVPQAVKEDPKLYEYLALVDAIRLGNPREVKIAADMLKKGLAIRE
jgi:hypothetical protein